MPRFYPMRPQVSTAVLPSSTKRATSPASSESTSSSSSFAPSVSSSPPTPYSTLFPESGPSRSARQDRPKAHIPRPRNRFILFRSWFARTQRFSEHESGSDVSKLAAAKWKTMNDAEKAEWEAKAVEDKRRHKEDHPDYKFQPSRPGTKRLAPTPARRPAQRKPERLTIKAPFPRERAPRRSTRSGIMDETLERDVPRAIKSTNVLPGPAFALPTSTEAPTCHPTSLDDALYTMPASPEIPFQPQSDNCFLQTPTTADHIVGYAPITPAKVSPTADAACRTNALFSTNGYAQYFSYSLDHTWTSTYTYGFDSYGYPLYAQPDDVLSTDFGIYTTGLTYEQSVAQMRGRYDMLLPTTGNLDTGMPSDPQAAAAAAASSPGSPSASQLSYWLA